MANYALEMNKLSAMELEFAIRGAQIRESLEYIHMMSEINHIRLGQAERVMYLTMKMKDDPVMLRDAVKIVENKKEMEYRKSMSVDAELSAVEKAEKHDLTKSGLLTAFKCALDVAVYRARALMLAVNNAALKKSVAALQQVQREVAAYHITERTVESIKENIQHPERMKVATPVQTPQAPAADRSPSLPDQSVPGRENPASASVPSSSWEPVNMARILKTDIPDQPYNVQIVTKVTPDSEFAYCGNGRFCKTMDEVKKYVNEHATGILHSDFPLEAGKTSSASVPSSSPMSFKDYVRSKIDLSDYDVSKQSNKVLECNRIFREEKADEIKLSGEKRAFSAWVGGMCSALPVAFEEPVQKAILEQYEINIPAGKDVSDVFYMSVTNSFFDSVKEEQEKSAGLDADDPLAAVLSGGAPDKENRQEEKKEAGNAPAL